MSARVIKIAAPALVLLAFFVASNAQVQDRSVTRETAKSASPMPAEHGWAEGKSFRRLPTTGRYSNVRRTNFFQTDGTQKPTVALTLQYGTTPTATQELLIGKAKIDELSLVGTITNPKDDGKIQLLPYDQVAKDVASSDLPVTYEVDVAQHQNQGEVEFQLVYSYQ
ncbi:hypothetical protein ACFL2H_14070, partial [Planctomycetota bacterium]